MDMNSFGSWETGIRNYCNENELSFEKAEAMKKIWGIDFLKLVHSAADHARESGADKVVLLIGRNQDGGPFVEQTEYTRQYLA